MLTIKHITICGEEEIRLADGVRYVPGVGGPESAGEQMPAVMAIFAKDDPVSMFGGTVFVMNDTGKTVARYDLGASPVPLDVDPSYRPARSIPVRAA
jgi:hypothetical protein